MIVSTLIMNVQPENRREFLQTLCSLIQTTRNEKGCISHHAYQDLENSNHFLSTADWESQADLDNYLRSDRFSVLMGAVRLLCEPPEFQFKEIVTTAGVEAIGAARSQRF